MIRWNKKLSWYVCRKANILYLNPLPTISYSILSHLMKFYSVWSKWKFVFTTLINLVLFCNRGDTIQYHGGLRSRELCQAPMLLVFLTPRQALSSHPRQCFCASLKLLFFMIFVGVHEFSSRLTTFSSCRRRGSNRWPLDHKSNAPPLHHGGLPTSILIFRSSINLNLSRK